MSSPPDNLDALLKLLSWKRHEQPPPSFFAEFPRRVLVRLEREPVMPALPWWQRLSLRLELSPALACSFGVLVCGLLLAGLVYSFQDEPSALDLQPAADIFSGLAIAPSLAPVSAGSSFQVSRSDAQSDANSLRSTAFPNFLFNGFNLQATPASYLPGNR